MGQVLDISAKRRRFAEEYVLDGNATAAAVRAGYSARSAHVTACRMLKDPVVQAAVAERQALVAEELEITRQEVMRGLLEAVEIARLQAEPAALVKAWSEIARICGYYQPERKQVEVSLSAKRVIDQLETMSDAELLRLAEQAVPLEVEG
jgi:phage terminase small subunit